MKYEKCKTCQVCGANLDFGEQCDCEKAEKVMPETQELTAQQMFMSCHGMQGDGDPLHPYIKCAARVRAGR